ncbi:MAG TPA: glycosyltransferase family 87 protein [Gaiellaceae bacterium]|nr:glycosyltransferase family 87 protein [Gaiellaceae bacterium]
MRRAVGLAALVLLLVAPAAQGAEQPTTPVYDGQGRLVQTPFAPAGPSRSLTEAQAIAKLLAVGKVKSWLERYPESSLVKEASYETDYRDWEVKIWSGKAGEIASGRVDDFTGAVTEAWTGPQVAWKMARGGGAAFGGKRINSLPVWLSFCAIFLLGLGDLRRPFSLRNLDLLALLSFSVSLWYFNHGHIFASVSLVYPGLAYLLLRTIWIGIRDRPPPVSRPVWPVWVLAAATVFVGGFKVGLNVRQSNVIDVGYAGPIGADRIEHGQSPYGHFPVEDDLKPCGPADRDGEIRERIQANGRCESANPSGDTYGPVSYLAYIPGLAFFGWSGKWDSLPAAHFTSIAFDLLCMVGLALVGWRFGRARLAVTLAFAWAAYPFTQYASNSNTNDAIMPAFLIFGFWLVTSPWARGILGGLASWTKFGALLVVPLWATYPEVRRSRRTALVFAGGFALATAASFWILLLEPNPLHAARVFWDRTIESQVDRESPFSIWDWRQYHAAGIPDLGWLQKVCQALLVAGALLAPFLPRRKSPLQLAALTAALLIGFEVVLTHWFYLYLPWFFAFVAFAVLAAEPRAVTAPATQPDEREHGLRDRIGPVPETVR